MKERLKGLIADFRYGKYNLLEEPPTFAVDYQSRLVTIDPLLHGNVERNDGDCLELSIAAAARIAKEIPTATIALCGGNEPKYARRTGVDNHTFLVVFPEGPGIPTGSYNALTLRAALDDRGAILVDPSLKRVGAFAEGGYLVTQFFYASPHIPIKRAVSVVDRQLIFLGMTKGGTVLSAGPCFEGNSVHFRFCAVRPYTDIRYVEGSELARITKGQPELSDITALFSASREPTVL